MSPRARPLVSGIKLPSCWRKAASFIPPESTLILCSFQSSQMSVGIQQQLASSKGTVVVRSAQLFSFFLFGKGVCFHVCWSTSVSFPEEQRGKNSKWGQIYLAVVLYCCLAVVLFPAGPTCSSISRMEHQAELRPPLGCWHLLHEWILRLRLHHRGDLRATIRGGIWSNKKM